MVQRSIELYSAGKIFMSSLGSQIFISASVSEKDINSEQAIYEVYRRIAELLDVSSCQIIHERCFANVELLTHILKSRNSVFAGNRLETDIPVTFVEGESCLGNRFSGIQIRAIKSADGNHVRTILDKGIPKGRTWTLDGSAFYMLQSIDGGAMHNPKVMDRKSQSELMFKQAEDILHKEGAEYRDVVRTWIYLSDILEWYNDFNKVRNERYQNFGFLRVEDSNVKAEKLYLPASTGIEGRNPSGTPATMDVFAIHRTPGSVLQIRPLYGIKQNSPFRYGSAFSRAVVIEEPGCKLILVSGTASIDEDGNSTHIGDAAGQIRHTFDVMSALIAPENATLRDLCEATVFFKRDSDYPVYRKIIDELGIPNLPSVNVIADVCRDELLFEIDAAFIVEKK